MNREVGGLRNIHENTRAIEERGRDFVIDQIVEKPQRLTLGAKGGQVERRGAIGPLVGR